MNDSEKDIPAIFRSHRGGIRVEQVAEILGVSRALVYRMAKDNQIPSVKLGCQVIFDGARLAAWWRSKEV